VTTGPGRDRGTPEAVSAAPRDQGVEQRVTAFLVTHGAGDLAHPGGTLLAHLRRTHRMLVAWDAPPALALAGLCHAIYGTDGYPHPFVELTHRHVVIDLVGAEAEAIVHRYARCDRATVGPQLGRRRPVAFRDRFTGATTHLDGADLRSLAELTVANELDVLDHHIALTADDRTVLSELLTRCRPLISPAAAAAVRTAFPDARPQ
jgi:hypothetical protein